MRTAGDCLISAALGYAWCMPQAKLNWAAAEVKDGTLSVGLEGEPSEEWRQSFETTVQLLRGGQWGEIRVEESTVQVSDVVPGTEEKLRHHLESVVDQANADTTEDEKQREDESEGEAAEEAGPDAQMTEQFRSFGETDEESDEDRDEES